MSRELDCCCTFLINSAPSCRGCWVLVRGYMSLISKMKLGIPGINTCVLYTRTIWFLLYMTYCTLLKRVILYLNTSPPSFPMAYLAIIFSPLCLLYFSVCSVVSLFIVDICPNFLDRCLVSDEHLLAVRT